VAATFCSLSSCVVSPWTTGSLAGLIGFAPWESMTCWRLLTVFCPLVTRACTALFCCEVRNAASLFSLMTETWLLISDSKIRSTIGVEMRLPSRSASASRGAAIRNLRFPSSGIDVTSHRSMPMMIKPHKTATGNDSTGLNPIALVSANHMDTVAMPEVMRIAQPRLWNLMRSVGHRSSTSVRAPEIVIRNPVLFRRSPLSAI
jgi:hypothetical protein